ncbi:Ig-like domain-containing protein [Dyadobacter sp. CY312]|uniref:Ig-like domain-containing protein n=1 Tax=Dyadobacter sp. CY312 TaxID=2907303 RepID=UPI001F3F3BF4|nr:Ig-like domain-containing protein [Dyadobacter sp. CY312]MCE7044636.1 Ig-like domain-containing protein [Dyadobacter sp. CY312]
MNKQIQRRGLTSWSAPKHNAFRLFAALFLAVCLAGSGMAQVVSPDTSKLVCNTPTRMNLPNYSFSIVGNSGCVPIIGFPCTQTWTGPYGVSLGAVTNEVNAVSASTTDAATFVAAVSAVGGMRLTVKSNNGYYPAGYFAGFDIQNTGVFGASILGSLTIRTYLGTTLQEEYSGNSGSLTANVVNDAGRATVGFVTTKNFDRIQIDQQQTISINLGTTQIFNAVVTKFCPEKMPRVCNTLEQWANPVFPVYVNQIGSGLSNVLCANCTVKNTANLVDADPNNFAQIDMLGSLGATAGISVKNAKTVYPAGSFAGFDIADDRVAQLTIGVTHTITTFKNGVQQEAVSDGGGLVDGGFFTSTGRIITGFKTQFAFDEIKFSSSNAAGISVLAPIRIYGAVVKNFCEGPALACNTNTKMVLPTYPVFVDARNTSINSAICAQCDIVDADNAIDADANNYTQLVIPANIATTAAYGITDGAKIYPANTFAGFDIENPNLIGAEALSGLTLSTTDQYGHVIESFTSNTGLISANSSILNGTGRQTVGFLATQPFSGVKITTSSVIKANIGTTRIYNAVFKKFCENPLVCNKLTAVTNPGYPVYVNGVHTSIDALGCVACQLNNSENIVDAATAIPATLVMGASVGSTAKVAVANALETYPAESFAGLDIESATLLSGEVLARMTINLYNNGTIVQSGTGTSLMAGVTTSLVTGGSNRQIVGIISKVPFDEVQLEVANLAGVDLGTIKIYRAYIQKSCATQLTCNFNAYLNAEDHGAVIDAEQTGTKGVACAGCEVKAPWNAVTKSTADYARIYNLASGAEVNSLAVAVPATTFPVGTFAGFTIKKNPFLISAGLFTNITITTYLNGMEQEVKSNGSLFDFSLLTQWFGTPTNFYNPGFYATKPFDEIKISVGSLAQAIDQYVDVYGAFVDTRSVASGAGLLCNVTNPDFNVTLVNVPVTGNVSTNDQVVAGTTYGSASSVPGVTNPNGAVPTINPDGTYTFVTNTPGVYQFLVPVCALGGATPCPNELLTITVLNDDPAVKNPPVANTDIASTKVNTPVTINTLVNDKPGDNDVQLVPGSVTITDLNGATAGNTSSGGTAVVNTTTGAITYTPPTGFVGKDTVKYTVCDTHVPALCASAYQIITVSGDGSTNNTLAADDYVTTQAGTTLTVSVANGVKANDTDKEGDTQTVTAQTTTVPGKGTLTLAADGSYTFVPEPGFTGEVDFPYTTTDAQGATANATLHILVDGKVPDLSPSISFLPATIIGSTKLGIILNVYEFNDVPTSGLITVYILKDPTYILSFNPADVNVKGQVVNNSKWIFDNSNPLYYILTTNEVIPASGGLAAGFTTTFNPGATKGSTVISTFIDSGSGGEVDDSNNADDDTLVYKP